MFDVSVCFGEALLRAEDKGAIGYIGGSNNTYWDEDFWWGVGSGNITSNPSYNNTSCYYFNNIILFIFFWYNKTIVLIIRYINL